MGKSEARQGVSYGPAVASSWTAPSVDFGKHSAAELSGIPRGTLAGVADSPPALPRRVDIQKRTVETGKVRVRKEVRMEVENIQVPTVLKNVDIERVPVNRFVDKPVAVRQEGGVWVIPILEEVPVIETRLRLKEEVRIRMRETASEHPEKVMLRREHSVVERLPLK